MRRMRSLSVSPSTYSSTMYGPPVLLAGVDHADDVRMAELRDGARLAAEALELVGVRRDLAMHQLDGDAPLERRVERAEDRRHPAGADLGVEAVPAVEAHADQRAHSVVRIVADVGTVSMRTVSRPRGGLSPQFAARGSITYVFSGVGGAQPDPGG